MSTRVLLLMLVLSLSSARGLAVFDSAFDSGSDGSDGAFIPAASVEIDLSLAATASWDTPSSVAGQGVYDADKWAVVFKYTTIDIPAGVTVTFKNHPSGAPVVWLASGDVTIDGTVLLDGPDGTDSFPVVFGDFTPGGFAGGRQGATFPLSTGGLGPGGGSPGLLGGSGGYATPGGDTGNGAGGAAYGNTSIIPLIGGSGGGGQPESGGGSGGGAILIASSGTITLSSGSMIRADGGVVPSNMNGGGGSGGAIRLIAGIVLSNGALRANGALNLAADGRIRVEADMISVNDSDPPASISSAPGPVFPPADAPTLKATFADGLAVPADPDAGILTTELEIDTLDLITISIEATNIPAGVTVEVRAAPSSGDFITATSTPLAPAGGGLLTATAELALPHGRSEIHLRANWTP